MMLVTCIITLYQLAALITEMKKVRLPRTLLDFGKLY